MRKTEAISIVIGLVALCLAALSVPVFQPWVRSHFIGAAASPTVVGSAGTNSGSQTNTAGASTSIQTGAPGGRTAVAGAALGSPYPPSLAVMVGAFPTAERARRAVADAGKLANVPTDRQVVTIDRVEGRTFYRATLTGFADQADAETHCSRLKLKGVACLVT